MDSFERVASSSVAAFASAAFAASVASVEASFAAEACQAYRPGLERLLAASSFVAAGS